MAQEQNVAELPKSSGQLIKYTVGHHRQKGVSHEDFVKWMTHEHIPAAIPLFKKHNISKYALVSILLPTRRPLLADPRNPRL